MEALARWMPLAVVAAILVFATFNARRLRRRLGHSPVTVFQSRSGVERARAWLALAGLCALAATGPWLRSPTEPNAEMGRSCGDCAEGW